MNGREPNRIFPPIYKYIDGLHVNKFFFYYIFVFISLFLFCYCCFCLFSTRRAFNSSSVSFHLTGSCVVVAFVAAVSVYFVFSVCNVRCFIITYSHLSYTNDLFVQMRCVEVDTVSVRVQLAAHVQLS